MEKNLRILLIFTVFALMVTQYQNCSNASDGAFWDGPGLDPGPIVQNETAAITTPNPTSILTPRDFFEIQGTCNPGVGQTGVLSYRIFAANGSAQNSPNSLFTTANCDSGRFTFLVPILPHQTCSGSTSCRYILRAQMQYAGKQIDLNDYIFLVNNF
jgi:hypothetical protein